MSSTQFWVGLLVPPIVKWASPLLKKFFDLPEFDAHTRERITAKQYPSYFSFLYGIWILALLASGIIALLSLLIYGPTLFPDKNYAVPVFLGLINMIGAWFIFGALLDGLFWRISSEHFRDYVMFRQLKEGWGYDIQQQIVTLFKIGFIYYLVMLPFILFLLFIW